MKIIKNIKEDVWVDFLLKNHGISGPEFLSSPNWLEIVRKEEPASEILAVVDDLDYSEHELKNSNILALLILIKKPLSNKFFYWYSPRGPVLNNDLTEAKQKEVIKFLIPAILRLNKKSLFLKLEPAQHRTKFWQTIFPTLSFSNLFLIKKVNPVQPKKTVILDLRKDLDDLLKAMHQKTRYNIRLARKKGVVIKEGRSEDFSEFWRLLKITGTRDDFKIHQEKHYQNLLSVNSDFIKLYFAEHEGKKIASAIVCFFGKKATYLHGASDNEYRKLMAPHLLQWEIIKQAKEAGNRIYDFYGVDEKKWPGVSRFKFGFSRIEKKYAGAYDIVYRPAMYRVYKLLRASFALFRRLRNRK